MNVQRLGALCALAVASCDPGPQVSGIDAGPVDGPVVDRIDAAPVAAIEILTEVSSDASELAIDGEYVYWLQESSVYRIARSASSGSVSELVVIPTAPPSALAVADGYVYWSSLEQRSIYRRPLAGGDEETVTTWTSPGQPARAIAVDDTHIYWREDRDLARADRGGGAREVVATGAGQLGALTIDADSVYFTTPEIGYDVWRVAKTGGSVTVAFGIIVLAGDSVLGNATGRILQCGKDSVDPYRSLIAGFSPPDGPGEVLAIIPDTAMAVAGDSKYAYCAADTGIHRVPRTSGAVQMLAGGQYIVSVAADDEGLYWLDQGTMTLHRRTER